jgi:flagellar basal-body rod protein FlgF
MRNGQIVASQGALRQQERISHIVSNNLSNAQTVGFKKDEPFFQHLLGESLESLQQGPITDVRTIFQQGTIQKTGNDLDVAIEGEGFFKVKTPDGIRYTRAGNLGLNKDKVLVTSNGFPVLGKQGEIALIGKSVKIDQDGTIQVDGSEVGQLGLVTFSKLDFLKKEGNSLFRLEGLQAETKVRDPHILQGTLETSNVNPIEEMVNLVDSLRSYESCLKSIQSQDEMDSRAVNDLGRV